MPNKPTEGNKPWNLEHNKCIFEKKSCKMREEAFSWSLYLFYIIMY